MRSAGGNQRRLVQRGLEQAAEFALVCVARRDHLVERDRLVVMLIDEVQRVFQPLDLCGAFAVGRADGLRGKLAVNLDPQLVDRVFDEDLAADRLAEKLLAQTLHQLQHVLVRCASAGEQAEGERGGLEDRLGILPGLLHGRGRQVEHPVPVHGGL